MFKMLFQLKRDYEDVKQQAFEETVSVFESKPSPKLSILFFLLTVSQWVCAVLFIDGFEILYEVWGFYPVIVFFLSTYFLFFSASKFLFKPSREELLDDTSKFALFSASHRKGSRSLYSIVLGSIHTILIVLYLVNKDLKFLDKIFYFSQ